MGPGWIPSPHGQKLGRERNRFQTSRRACCFVGWYFYFIPFYFFFRFPDLRYMIAESPIVYYRSPLYTYNMVYGRGDNLSLKYFNFFNRITCDINRVPLTATGLFIHLALFIYSFVFIFIFFYFIFLSNAYRAMAMCMRIVIGGLPFLLSLNGGIMFEILEIRQTPSWTHVKWDCDEFGVRKTIVCNAQFRFYEFWSFHIPLPILSLD